MIDWLVVVWFAQRNYEWEGLLKATAGSLGFHCKEKSGKGRNRVPSSKASHIQRGKIEYESRIALASRRCPVVAKTAVDCTYASSQRTTARNVPSRYLRHMTTTASYLVHADIRTICEHAGQ